MDTNFLLSMPEIVSSVESLTAFVLIACVVAFVIFGVGKKSKFAMIFIPSCAVLYFVTTILAVNNIPEFIRRIPGESYIGKYLRYETAVFIVTLIYLLTYYEKNYGRILDAAQHKLLSDSDLMLLQNFDRYRMVGYYLFKAKLDGLINVRVIPATEESAEDTRVTLNREISPEDLEAYCQANPQVAKIIDCVGEHVGRNKPIFSDEGERTVRLLDIIGGIYVRPEMNSDGGKFVEKELALISKKTIQILLISAVVAIYPAVIKLIMGLQNLKPVDNLFGMMVMTAIGFFMFFGIMISIKGQRDSGMIAKLVTSKKSICRDPEKLFNLVSLTDAKFKEQDIIYMLRAYTLYNYPSYNCGINSEDPFVSSVFGAIKALQYAQYLEELKKNSDSGSGCSSCSSCSSCGSCGGCGGCGD